MREAALARLSFIIHDMNTWAGQERCTLEVARRLSRRWPLDVYAFTLADPDLSGRWGTVRFHRIRPHIERPFMLKETLFYIATAPLLWGARLARRPRPLLHAAGACSLVSDVVQIHFVHAAWKARLTSLPESMRLPPGAARSGGMATLLLRAYHSTTLAYHLLMERLVYTRGKTYIAVSEMIAREMRDHFGITQKLHVVRHGVDPLVFFPMNEATRREREQLRESLGFGPDDLVALFVGAFERKGLGPALEALASLEPEHLRRVRLLAIGSGARGRFEEMARRLGVADRLIFAPHQREIAPHYSAADLFVFPTVYEPFGMVILEAMACGLPVIVSRAAGASELIEHGESGLLLEDPSDPAEIARALRALVADDAARARIGRAAARVAGKRSWDQVAREYEEILGPLIDGAGAASA